MDKPKSHMFGHKHIKTVNIERQLHIVTAQFGDCCASFLGNLKSIPQDAIIDEVVVEYPKDSENWFYINFHIERIVE